MSSIATPSTDAPADLAVRLRGIGKRFPGVIANDDINIDVRGGTIHAIVGENGAGYSTSGGCIDDITSKLDAYKQDIIDGKITVPTEPK